MDQAIPPILNISSAIPNLPSQSSAATRAIRWNRVPLSENEIAIVDRAFGKYLATGLYWYDALSGAWGHEGSGRSGQIKPGLKVGGPMREDASNGRSGVFVNGRQLNFWEAAKLRLTTSLQPGRYWMDCEETFGIEGGQPLGNLRILRAQATRMVLYAATASGIGDMMNSACQTGYNY